jgi:hypothetical protein
MKRDLILAMPRNQKEKSNEKEFETQMTLDFQEY